MLHQEGVRRVPSITAPDEHPRPWRTVEHRSAVVLMDADGAVVATLPFTGRSSQDRKRRTADLIVALVNERPG